MDIFTTFISPRAQTHKYTLLRADKIEKGARNEGNLLVVACKLADLSSFRENDKSNFNITKNRKLEGFFDQFIFAFGESKLAAARVLDAFHLHLRFLHFQISPNQRKNVSSSSG